MTAPTRTPRRFAAYTARQLATSARLLAGSIRWHEDPRHTDPHAAAVHRRTLAAIEAEQRRRAALAELAA